MSAVLISCDEAGFTGPGLLDEHQPVFAYSAHSVPEDESREIVEAIRRKYRVQAPELKSQLLKQRSNWPEIAVEVLGLVSGRATVIAMDKRLSLAAKTFEYLFEPVIADWSTLFYGRDLHRYVMNALHQALFKSGASVPELAKELQLFMRHFDPALVPSLFGPPGTALDPKEPLSDILKFAQGYASVIASENAHLQRGVSDLGKWALDLTSSALFSLLVRHWGLRHDQLDVLCDDSKPLRAMSEFFNSFVGRSESFEMAGPRGPLIVRCNLANPLRFGSSVSHASLQVADVLAGATADAIRKADDPNYEALMQALSPLLHEDIVLPDPRICDITMIPAFLNRLALKELADRASRGAHPYERMDVFYAFMEEQLRQELSK